MGNTNSHFFGLKIFFSSKEHSYTFCGYKIFEDITITSNML